VGKGGEKKNHRTKSIQNSAQEGAFNKAISLVGPVSKTESHKIGSGRKRRSVNEKRLNPAVFLLRPRKIHKGGGGPSGKKNRGMYYHLATLGAPDTESEKGYQNRQRAKREKMHL